MKRKILIVLSTILLTFGLYSCVSHEHTLGSYENNESKHWIICSECGEIMTEAPHNLSEKERYNPTCTEDGYIKYKCFACGFEKEEHIDALGHDYINTTITATCEREGGIKHSCSRCGDEYFEKTSDKVDHNYTITYTWNTYNSKCSAKAVCIYCSETIEESANSVYTSISSATCSTSGNDKYVATFTNPLFTTQQKNVTIPATNHNYSEASYEWNADNSKCTAKRTCSACGDIQTETSISSSQVTKESTCGVEGSIKYTASFINSAFATQTKTISTEALTHNYVNPTYTWNNDNTKCTATIICSHCQDAISETADSQKTTITAATCSSKGSEKYSVEFNKTEYFTTQSKTKDIDTIPHTYGTPTYTWDGVDSCKAKICCTKCDHFIEENGTITYSTEDDVLCGQDEERTYSSVFTTTALFGTVTKKVTVTSSGHTLVFVKEVYPTCSSSGVVAHFECTRCNHCFSDIKGENEIVDLTIGKLSHTIIPINAKEATCECEGNIKYYKCALCGETFSDAQGNTVIDEDDYIIPALGHNYEGITYNLIKNTSEIIDGEKYVLVAKSGTKYYSVTTNTNKSFKEISVDNNKITNLPNGIQTFEIVPAPTTGTYFLYIESGIYTKKFLSSYQEGNLNAYEKANSYNSERWEITFDANGLATIAAKGTNKGKLLAYNKTDNKLTGTEAYSSTLLQLYIFRRTLNDVNEVRLENGSVGQYFYCDRCNKYHDINGAEIKVSCIYKPITASDTIYFDDEVILLNSYYKYTIQYGAMSSKYDIWDRVKTNNTLTDDHNIQTFKIKRGLYKDSYRFAGLNEDSTIRGYLYCTTSDVSKKYNLALSTYLTTSMSTGSFYYTQYDTYRGSLVCAKDDLVYNTIMGTQDNFFVESKNNSPYGYSSRYITILRKVYTK